LVVGGRGVEGASVFPCLRGEIEFQNAQALRVFAAKSFVQTTKIFDSQQNANYDIRISPYFPLDFLRFSCGRAVFRCFSGNFCSACRERPIILAISSHFGEAIVSFHWSLLPFC